MLFRVRAGLGSRLHWRNRGSLPASRTRSLRLLPGLRVARARSRPLHALTRLDEEMRLGTEGLAQAGSGVPMIDAARIRRLAGVVVAASALALVGTVAAQSVQHGGNGTLVAGSYGGDIMIIAESSFAVLGKMKFGHGVPIGIIFTRDKKRIYVSDITGEHVEVFDMATRQKVDSFS